MLPPSPHPSHPHPSYPPLLGGWVVYAVGDIHGRSDLLDRLHADIDADAIGRSTQALEIYLGDYVDRGPDSAGVIQRLMRRAEERRVVLIRGNHEVMFETFLDGGVEPDYMRRVGGYETLQSYGVDVRALIGAPRGKWVREAERRVPAEHRAFLCALCDRFELGGYFFTHAGVQPGIPLSAQTAQDLQWIRDAFLGDASDHGAIIVHGHTPMPAPEFRTNRINIDTGAYVTGRLTCLVIDEHGPRTLQP